MIPASRSFGRLPADALIVLFLFGLCAAAGTSARAQKPITTVASFDGADGESPSGVTFDSSGNLFGTTSEGGANHSGTVFEIAKGSTQIKTIASFTYANGANPEAGVTFDNQGNLFGTTEEGGASNGGTVYEIAEGSTAIMGLASFNGTNGANPESGVTLDSQGNLFGAAFEGGAHNEGTVYEIAKGSTQIKTLASFNTKDGDNPESGVTLDSQGNLFGAALGGGARDAGTVYEIAKGSTQIKILAFFTGTNGAKPAFHVTFDRSGNLFGTTYQGGTKNLGTVYEIAQGTTRIQTLASFSGANGKGPNSPVTFDSQGNLFGTTQYGGAKNDGTVFEIARGSTRIQTVVSFKGTNGSQPSGMTFDSSGNLFGTTFEGGTRGFGTVFEIAGAGSPSAALGSSSGMPKPPRRAALFLTALLLTVPSLGSLVLRTRNGTQDTNTAE